MEGDSMKSIKCVVVGDDSVGKSTMLVSYATRKFPNIVPDIFDNYAGCIGIDGSLHQLSLIDTSKQIDSEGLRKHLYEGADLFLVCFSVVRPESMESVEERWVPDIRKDFPQTPIILIGTQTDLRDSRTVLQLLDNESRSPSVATEGAIFAKRLGARGYMEFSPLHQRKLKTTLDCTVASALSQQQRSRPKKGSSNCKVM